MKRLIAKGTEVLFEMHDGRDIEPRSRYALLHDPDGVVWAKCSLLVMPFDRGGAPLSDDDADSRDYFGAAYVRKVGSVDTPPSDLTEWQEVGAVRRIYYYRDGVKYPGDFKHTFGKRSIASLFRSGEAVLHKRGSLYRLELPDWCSVDDRGIVAP